MGAYPWSNYRGYLTKEKRSHWLNVNQILERFPQKGHLKAFQEYMGSKGEEGLRRFYESKIGMPILGSKGFLERIREKVRKGKKEVREIPEAKRSIPPTMQECFEAVKSVYGVREEERYSEVTRRFKRFSKGEPRRDLTRSQKLPDVHGYIQGLSMETRNFPNPQRIKQCSYPMCEPKEGLY